MKRSHQEQLSFCARPEADQRPTDLSDLSIKLVLGHRQWIVVKTWLRCAPTP